MRRSLPMLATLMAAALLLGCALLLQTHAVPDAASTQETPVPGAAAGAAGTAPR